MATLLALTESNRYYSNHACHTQLVIKVTYNKRSDANNVCNLEPSFSLALLAVRESNPNKATMPAIRWLEW